MDITIQYKYVKHDVDNWTYRLSEMANAEDGKRKAMGQSDDSPTDATFIRRKIGEAMVELRLLLDERLESLTAPEEANDTLDKEQAEWVMTLTDDDRTASAAEVATLAHRYVVRYVLWCWCLIYFGTMASTFYQEMTAIADEIKQAAYKRTPPRKYKRKPWTDVDELIVETR